MHGEEFDRLAGSDIEVQHGSAHIAAHGVELGTRQRGHELDPRVSMRACLPFAVIEEKRTNPAPRMIRVDKKSADFRGLRFWVEYRGIAAGTRIAAEQRRSVTPSAAAHHLTAFIDNEIGLIGEQLTVDAEGASQGALDLLRTIIPGAQTARRSRDQILKGRYISYRGLAQGGHGVRSVAVCRLVVVFEPQDSGRIDVYTRPIEPRSIGGVLDDGLRLWRDSLPKTWPLALLAQLAVALPLLMLAYKFPGIGSPMPARAVSAANLAGAQAMLALFRSPTTWLAYLGILIFSTLCYTAIVLRVAGMAAGAATSLGGSLMAALRLLPRLFLQFLLFFALAVLIGIVLILLVGVWMAAMGRGGMMFAVVLPAALFIVALFCLGRLIFASIVLILDNAGPAESISISWRLTRGYWWRCSGILLVLFVIGLVFTLVVGFASAAVGAVLRPSFFGASVTQLASLVVNAFLGSLFPAVLVAILYDLKLRKQGGDLLNRVDALALQ